MCSLLCRTMLLQINIERVSIFIVFTCRVLGDSAQKQTFSSVTLVSLATYVFTHSVRTAIGLFVVRTVSDFKLHCSQDIPVAFDERSFVLA